MSLLAPKRKDSPARPRGAGANEELITPDNLSPAFLKSVLDAAMMDTVVDDDVLKVQEEVTCYVLPSEEAKDRIQLITQFGFERGTSRLQQLEFVNEINATYIIVKATVGKNNTLRFTFDISIAGGITKKAFVLAVKRFCGIPRAAIADCGYDLVE